MKLIQKTGLVLFLIGLSIFTASIFTGSFSLSSSELESYIQEKGYKNALIKDELEKAIVTNEHLNIFAFSSRVRKAYRNSNAFYDDLIAKYDSEKIGQKKEHNFNIKYSENHIL